MNTGDRIREGRSLLGYSREQLAEKAGISPQFLSDIERINKRMSIDVLKQLSSSLRLSTDYLLFGNEQFHAENQYTAFTEVLASLTEVERGSVVKVLSLAIKLLDAEN